MAGSTALPNTGVVHGGLHGRWADSAYTHALMFQPSSIPSPAQPPEPDDAPLHILWRDEHLVAVYKPAGWLVHRTRFGRRLTHLASGIRAADLRAPCCRDVPLMAAVHF